VKKPTIDENRRCPIVCLDVLYPGMPMRNTRDKSSTFTVEGVHVDSRHYIPILARRNRCFPESIETLRAVMEVFVAAYNRFGAAKHKYRQTCITRELPFSIIGFL